jgi:hypothetical protein
MDGRWTAIKSGRFPSSAAREGSTPYASMASKTTTILPVRVEHELVARLDALSAALEASTRTGLAREALRRGLELLESESRPAQSAAAAPAPPLEAAVSQRQSETPSPETAVSQRQSEAPPSQSSTEQPPAPVRAVSKAAAPPSAALLELFPLEAASPSAPAPAPRPASPSKPQQPQSPGAPRPAASTSRPKPQHESGLEKFARDALEAARGSRTGWLAPDRLFIVHAWRQYRREHPKRPPSLAMYKALLLQARRKGLVTLAPDEMAVFHKQSDVDGSRSEYLGETFHLLCVERSAQSWRHVF